MVPGQLVQEQALCMRAYMYIHIHVHAHELKTMSGKYS